MSQTELNIVVRRLFTSIPKFACFLQAAAIILAMALPASAASIWWQGTSSTLWSNTSNWNLTGPSPAVANPGSPVGNDVIFTNDGTTASSSTFTNEVTANTTVNTMTYSQQDPSTSSRVYHNTKIDPGVTLKISGTYTVSDTAVYGIPGAYSMYAGAANVLPATNLTSKTLFTGGGSLDVSTSTGDNTGGDIVVRELSDGHSGYNGAQLALLDLSGLTSFNANVDQLLVGYSSALNSTYPENQRAIGSLYLARNNTITLNSTATGGSSTGAGLVIGFDSGAGNVSGNNITGSSSLYLGQTNTIYVNNVWVGSAKSGGSLSFNPAFSGSTLYMRGVNPSGGDNTFTPVNSIYIGEGSNTGSGPCSGVLDLTGGTVDILATQIVVGRDNTTASTNTRPITGSLIFNGQISTSTMIIGQHSSSASNPNCTGTVYVGVGSNLTVGSEMQMASFAGGTVGSATANLNISGGLLTMGGNIDKGVTAPGTPVNTQPPTSTPTPGSSTANITLTGGTLDMGGHDIGFLGTNPSITAVPIDNFTIRGGALNNVGNLVVTNFIAAGNVSPLSGTVTIANNGKIDLRDGTAQTLSAANLTLLGSTTLYFELGTDNSTSHSDYINLNGGIFNINGALSILVSRLGGSFASPPNNTYTLISYGNHTGLNSLSFTNTTRNIMVPNLGATALTLQVTNVPGHDLTWAGGTSGTWDVINPSNTVWTSDQAPSPDMYYDMDNVTFGTQTGSTIIQLSNTASSNGFIPGSVTVDSANDYTFNAASSTDRISGSTGLTKNGTGTLYMNLANDYLGTTTLNAGKTVLGNATALGSASAPLIIGSNATLDLNVMQLYTKPVTVQGAGADGVSGAIVNNNTTTTPAGTQYDIGNLTLSGNTTIGGISTAAPSNSGLPGSQYIGRWALRAQTGSAYLHTTGAFSLTKTGNNQIMLVNTIADSALADINVKEGVLSLEGSTTLGNTAGTITVDGLGVGGSQLAGGSILQLRNLSVPLNKQVLLKNNGQLYALLNGTDTDNTVSGTVTIDGSGGIVNAGGQRDDYPSNTPNANARLILSGDILGSGPMIKRGPGTAILSSASSSFNGTTSVEDGTLIVNGTLHGSVTLHTSPTTGVTTVLAGIGTICGTGVTVTDAPGIIIAPGPSYSSTSTSVGTLTVADMTFDNASTLSIELNGTAAGQFDVLNSTGTLALQGACTLAVTLGYTPANGDSFDIINWGTLAGPGFGTLSLPALPDSLSWDTSNLYTIGSIAVIPEPAALLMLIMAAGLGLMLKRFRNR